VLGHTSLTSAVANSQFLTVSQRWVGTRGVNSASTTSSAWTVPGRSRTTAPCSNAGSTGPVPGSSQTRGLSCSSARSTGSVPGSSQPRSTTPLVPSRSTPGTGSVRNSRDTFPLEDSHSLTIYGGLVCSLVSSAVSSCYAVLHHQHCHGGCIFPPRGIKFSVILFVSKPLKRL